MYIVHLIRYFYPHIGGNENQAFRLIQSIKSKSSHDIVVYTYRYSSKLLSEEDIEGIHVKRLSFLLWFIEFLRWLKVKLEINLFQRILSRLILYIEEFDVFISFYAEVKKNRAEISLLHIHQLTTIALVASKLKKKYRIPYIVKDATTDGLSFFNIIPFGNKAINSIVVNGVFIAMTSVIRNCLLNRGIKAEQIHLIPNGITVSDRFIKNSFSNNGQILFIGNYDQGKIKGLDLLIDAFIILRKQGCKFSLLVAGRGCPDIYMNKLSHNGLGENECQFIGPVKDVEKLYKESNVYVLPSRAEGFSNSLIEALLWGIPCVSTDVSSARELIEDKVNGRIAQAEDAESLAECIKYCINNKVDDWALLSYDRIKKNFSFNIISQKYIELYNIMCK